MNNTVLKDQTKNKNMQDKYYNEKGSSKTVVGGPYTQWLEAITIVG